MVLGSVVPPSMPRSRSILSPEVRPIDLNTALRLAGVQNPDAAGRRQRVLEAVAMRQLAAAQFLPSFNGGTSYDTHTGVLQQSNGNILSVNRSSVYVGAGANAVAAGTVTIPGCSLTGNVAEGIFRYLVARQVVRQAEFASLAVRNQAFLRVCLGLLRPAPGRGSSGHRRADRAGRGAGGEDHRGLRPDRRRAAGGRRPGGHRAGRGGGPRSGSARGRS